MAKPHARSSSARPNRADAPGEYIAPDVRVDPPHAADSAPPRPDDAAPTASQTFDGPLLEVDEDAEFAGDTVESLQNQAQQLSLLLRDRQEMLDRREAEWQQQLARHDKECRAARLWLEGRREELTEREATLQTDAAEIERRYATLRDAESALDLLRREREAELSAREAMLAAREETIRLREAELTDLLTRQTIELAALSTARHDAETARAEFEHEMHQRRAEFEAETAAARREAASLGERQAELERLAAEPSEFQRRMQVELDEREASLDRREAGLDDQESRVRQGLIDAERLQAELRLERERLAAQERRDRLDVAEQRRRAEQETATARKALERQNEQLDFRRAALRQEQADLNEAQRETLEMRLAAEELWTQLAGSVPPAVLGEGLNRVRSRLAEQYRLQQHEIAAERTELETLRADLAAEGEKIRIQTAELRRWAEARHDEIERQAAFLTKREAELDQQETEHRRRAHEWRHERGRLEQELRRLQHEARLTRAG